MYLAWQLGGLSEWALLLCLQMQVGV